MINVIFQENIQLFSKSRNLIKIYINGMFHRKNVLDFVLNFSRKFLSYCSVECIILECKIMFSFLKLRTVKIKTFQR